LQVAPATDPQLRPLKATQVTHEIQARERGVTKRKKLEQNPRTLGRTLGII